jgi:hypothetical protein
VPQTGLEPVTQEFSILCSTIGATAAINMIMTIFNFDNFYYTHIDIENYDVIIKEIKFHTKTILNEIGKYSGFFEISKKDLNDNCPALLNWFNKNDIILEMAALHLMPAHREGQLHSDNDESLRPRLALNLDIENSDLTKTILFKVNNSGNLSSTPRGLPYVLYQYSEDTCKKITEYDLSKPVLFDTAKPHLVTNNTNYRRVAISLRFKSDPIHLIIGRT